MAWKEKDVCLRQKNLQNCEADYTWKRVILIKHLNDSFLLSSPNISTLLQELSLEGIFKKEFACKNWRYIKNLNSLQIVQLKM